MKTELIFPTPVWKFNNVGIDRQSLTNFVYFVKSEKKSFSLKANWLIHPQIATLSQNFIV